ncbi:ubiquitin thiolesterase-like protein [Lasiosphaeria hispida]|uniref:ubiquitinyl hydrolase 1 n=1 Tax=Lasiosphaeria hispida TaxID=260671 RepID=A0AAJ0HBP8_9PEZI|nr:ubiquitin thiolesterase-like protein [Lasiosphaeria hispida]
MAQTPAKRGSVENSPGSGENNAPATLRRSGRARKPPPLLYGDDVDADSRPSASTSPTVALQPAGPSRRNPKRKAAPEVFDVPENLLEASLGPWEQDEQDEWPSWTEMESDPAFFNGILGLLGVRGAKSEELFSVDEDSLASLPAPVYGLVFLYEYIEEESPSSTEASTGLWFANQTTHSACATIAMFNIIMNAEGLALGEKLRRFKQQSIDLAPPLRGNLITNSAWIRVAHNSFARRLDLLNAALSLHNDVDDDKKPKRAKSSSARHKKKKPPTDAAYHFIAFVPVGRTVWQLDGLEAKPLRIDDFDEEQHWTSVARPVIEARMMQYETEQLSFNLLALCGDHLASIRRDLAINIRCIEELDSRWRNSPGWLDLDTGDGNLKEYQLEPEDVKILSDGTPELLDFYKTVCAVLVQVTEALEHRQRLWEDQTHIRTAYTAELALQDQKTANAPGRKKDHTPAIHEWVKRLVDHGVLAQLHEEAQLHSQL